MSYRNNDRSAGGGYRDYDSPPHGERDRAYDGGRGGGGGGGAAPYDRGLPYRERGGEREPYRAGPGERGPPPPPRRSNSPPPRRGYEQRGPLSGMRGGRADPYPPAGRGPPPPPRERDGYGERAAPPPPRERDGYGDRAPPPPRDRDAHADRAPPPRERDSYARDPRGPPPGREREPYRGAERGVPPAREREDAYGRARERSPERSVRERERDAPSRRERERDAPSRRERDDYREEHAAHDEEGPSERASGKGRAEKKQEEEEEEEEVQGEDDAAMMAMMGFGNFGTTKNKKVEGNAEGFAEVRKERTWRQYMNRVGGFNRPLDHIK
ncbi:hypothetical protein FA09DRAFT_337595 [Tilletiopsis washingtonensis]|uniref:U4/U6.U5 small nuclear ribonucleoprotein 27kDa protein domain-containing protein n=1 Tax=Tilletiopsis washingtonensis TaxID=58919 RepID=A0A316ZGN3_9BASI|nr:hypothetical protein FA09DRAFT_337595 [Tilletiopsis washingtonensis]PWN99475.1 hypothetical protein FA09DRAFT_337595 [Tilletiopsis washingtonensis]